MIESQIAASFRFYLLLCLLLLLGYFFLGYPALVEVHLAISHILMVPKAEKTERMSSSVRSLWMDATYRRLKARPWGCKARKFFFVFFFFVFFFLFFLILYIINFI